MIGRPRPAAGRPSSADAARFRPAAWLPGPHSQTIFGALLRAWPRPRTARERWDLPDGDFVDVDVLAGPPGSPALLLLHGLEGSARSHYVRGMLALAERRGLRAFALNFRSCSDEPNRLLRSYHSGETSDLDHAVRRLIPRVSAPLLLAGFSLGGNVLVKWLGEQGASAPREIAAAAAVSVPFDLAACAAALDGPGLAAYLYRSRFLATLKRKALAKAGSSNGSIDAARVASARTLSEFDDAVTAPVHGFASAADYWARCSSGPFVRDVRVPLLVVTSVDDPIVPGGCLPPDRFADNPAVTLEEVAEGGHVGFISGPPWAPRYWAEERVMQFFAEKLSVFGSRLAR